MKKSSPARHAVTVKDRVLSTGPSILGPSTSLLSLLHRGRNHLRIGLHVRPLGAGTGRAQRLQP